MIKTRSIDKHDPHKLVEIPIALGSLTDAVETAEASYICPTKCVLVGMQILVQSTGNADNTLRIKVKDGSTVLLDSGAYTVGTTPAAQRFLASGVDASPASDSSLGGLFQINAGDTLTITDIVAGTAAAANNCVVILEFEGA